MTIVELASNRPLARFYRGGARIAEFRGIDGVGDHEPEDWVGSVTTVRGESAAGLTRLPDGRLLTDAVAADPEHWLGAAHVAAFGADPMLLVKILDAGQRLPVHAHPDRAFAREHLGAAHGKTEAWCILTPGTVWVGLSRRLADDELADLLERQDTATLLAAMHRIEVEPGDVVLVPAGVLHAIDEGILLVELQEPEDLSILVEWEGFAIDGAALGHLGLGFERALGAVETTARSADEVLRLVHRAGAEWMVSMMSPLRGDHSTRRLPPEADPYFRLDRVEVDDAGSVSLEAGFSILVGLSGSVRTAGADGTVVDVRRGSTVLVAAAAGRTVISGRGDVLVCRPPAAG